VRPTDHPLSGFPQEPQNFRFPGFSALQLGHVSVWGEPHSRRT